jgi:predicted alpha/beta-hydrolase family hydrolase
MARRRSWATGATTSIGSLVDAAILGAMRLRFDKKAPAPVEDRRAALFDVIAFYRKLGDGLFAEPRAAAVREERRGALADGGEIVDVAWPSTYEPAYAPIRQAYLAYEANRRACARLFRHGGAARNTIVLLHGYRSGAFFIEERAFPVRWLYRLGLDVVLFTLPFHALRGHARTPPWPSANPARSNEGFGQAIHDLRSLTKWLAPPALAMAGMSLGGYTTALFATVEPLAFACPMIPVASFPDLYWHHGDGRPERLRAEREGITLQLMQEAMAVHTPLLRTPKIRGDQALVVSAAGDRIAPPEHAERLAAHFGCEELRFAGGHVLQVGRGDAFRALARKLAALGLIQRR